MPARSNEFQVLVHLIQAALAPEGFTVTQSKFLNDLRDGTAREVDVVIEGKVGPNRIVVCVEVKDTGRRVDIGWVEQLCAKHDNLETSKLILVSRRGFSKRAAEEARLRRAEAITLNEAKGMDWLRPVQLKEMVLKARRLFPTELRIAIEDTPGQTFNAHPKDFVLNFENGARKVPLPAVIEHAFDDSDLMKSMEEDKTGPDNWRWPAIMTFRPGTRLEAPTGDSAIIHNLRFVARYVESTDTVRLQFGRLGDINILHGSAKAAFGDVVAVMPEQDGDPPMISLEVIPGTQKKSKGVVRIEWRDVEP